MTEINYSKCCVYRLPCGICTRTNSYCPISNGTVDVTWASESTITSTGITLNPEAMGAKKVVDHE